MSDFKFMLPEIPFTLCNENVYGGHKHITHEQFSKLINDFETKLRRIPKLYTPGIPIVGGFYKGEQFYTLLVNKFNPQPKPPMPIHRTLTSKYFYFIPYASH